jgi:hypothetical protein
MDYAKEIEDGAAQPIVMDPFAVSRYRFSGDRSRLADGTPQKAQPGETVNCDHKLVANRKINGGTILAVGAQPGDWFSAEVCDVDNLLGYGAGTTLDTFINGWWVHPDKIMELELPYGSDIAVGFYIRLVYHAASAGGERTILVNLNLHRKL